LNDRLRAFRGRVAADVVSSNVFILVSVDSVGVECKTYVFAFEQTMIIAKKQANFAII
jgi:hypothetical protein